MRLRSVRGRLRRWPPTTGVGWARLALFLVVAPALCVYLLVNMPDAYRASLAASRWEGTPGHFTAMTEQCGRYSCEVSGDFVSDDGSIHLSDEMFRGDVEVGHSVRALYEPFGHHAGGLYAPGDSGELHATVALSAVAAAYLLGTLGYVTVALLPRRRRN